MLGTPLSPRKRGPRRAALWQGNEDHVEAGSATTRRSPRLRGGGRRRLSELIKRSFSLAGHRTSVALEEEFWAALTQIAAARQQTLTALVAATDAERGAGRPLASALRVLALREFSARR